MKFTFAASILLTSLFATANLATEQSIEIDERTPAQSISSSEESLPNRELKISFTWGRDRSGGSGCPC